MTRKAQTHHSDIQSRWPRRIGVLLDVSPGPEWLETTLRSALSLAMEAWNISLSGVIVFCNSQYPVDARVLVRARQHALGGLYRGVALSSQHRHLAAGFDWEVYLETHHRAAADAKPIYPGDLYMTLSHELGHTLGLDETADPDCIMCDATIRKRLISPPFLPGARLVTDLVGVTTDRLNSTELAATSAHEANDTALGAPYNVETCIEHLMDQESLPGSVQSFWRSCLHNVCGRYSETYEIQMTQADLSRCPDSLIHASGRAKQCLDDPGCWWDVMRALQIDPESLDACEMLYDMVTREPFPWLPMLRSKYKYLLCRAAIQDVRLILPYERRVLPRVLLILDMIYLKMWRAYYMWNSRAFVHFINSFPVSEGEMSVREREAP